jgi:hypothetical protein
MTQWHNGITEQEFINAVNRAVVFALEHGVNSDVADYDDYVRAHLKLWKESGIDAPANEANSIQAWLQFLGEHTREETISTMQARMLLLMEAADAVYEEGPAVEDAIGIYDNRPDMDRGR